jgi:N-acetyl sugar amidotransferase
MTVPHYIRYCTRCVMPETKPDLKIDAGGICSACRYLEHRKAVDWDARKKELLQLIDKYRSKNKSNWDCIVPVSGGKDSTFQVIKMLEFGLNPLCVTATTCKLSRIGHRNLANIKKLGVDSYEVTTNPLIRRKINRLTLEQIGDISWPEHLTIFTTPVRVAVQLGIPLIVWGENSQNEYGGPSANAHSNILTRRWLEEFGGLLGLRVTDLIGQAGIEAKHLIAYTYPSDAELARVGVTGIFLGHYIPWDGYTNVLVAEGHGFESWSGPVEGSIVNYENLDNVHMGIHDYFKFIKYAFGRGTDLACLHLRRGRLTRADALTLVKRHDGAYPWSYLGVSLEEQLEEMGMTVTEFDKICDRFTNKRLFVCDTRGNLVRDAKKNLIKINYDNMPPQETMVIQ